METAGAWSAAEARDGDVAAADLVVAAAKQCDHSTLRHGDSVVRPRHS